MIITKRINFPIKVIEDKFKQIEQIVKEVNELLVEHQLPLIAFEISNANSSEAS